MSEFVVVTRKDNGAKQIVNLDAVERVDINPPVPLPPLDSNAPITEEHLGGAVIHFRDSERPHRVGVDSLVILETAEDFLNLTDSSRAFEAADKLAKDREKQLDKLRADREKERAKAAADKAKAEVDQTKEQMKVAQKAAKPPRAKRAKKAKA